jgi:Protein of unknown function (DUF1812).
MDRKSNTCVPLLLAIFILSSCIKENEDNCGVTVRFAYTYNIMSANALKSQVDEVSLYVFDEDSILVRQHTNVSTSLINDFIRLTDLRSGNYHFVACAQSKHITSDQSYFSIPDLKTGVSRVDDLTYMMKREASGFQRHELNNFLVGVADVAVNGSSLSVTIDLKKVNNKIRVVILPNVPGSALDVADYEFSVVDMVGNGHINYDYSLLPDKQITYLPYYAANLTPKDPEALLPDEIDRVAVVEINTSRLIAENVSRLRIVDKKEGWEIVSMNLPWVFSLTGMENNNKWSLQEYLDRQDMYSIMLYFDDRTWTNGYLSINGWVINIKNIEL